MSKSLEKEEEKKKEEKEINFDFKGCDAAGSWQPKNPSAHHENFTIAISNETAHVGSFFESIL